MTKAHDYGPISSRGIATNLCRRAIQNTKASRKSFYRAILCCEEVSKGEITERNKDLVSLYKGEFEPAYYSEPHTYHVVKNEIIYGTISER